MDPGEIYTAAVLHDIGKLVYQKFSPEHYLKMIQYCKKKKVFLCDAEKEFGFPSHGRLGALLCNRWQLGDNLENACENHELETLNEALRAGDELPPDLKVVALSNLLACLAGDTLNNELNVQITAAIRDTVKISEDEFLVLMGDVYDLKTEVSRFMAQL
jgi:HD-like signal output (HDOD) protein